MAYDDSEALQPNSTYSLGDYTFELKVQTVHEPGEPDVVSVFAICRSPDGTRETVPMDFPPGTTVESWAVEANETEATVYATVNNNIPIVTVQSVGYSGYYLDRYGPAERLATFSGRLNFGAILAASSQGTLTGSFTYYGKTVYFYAVEGTFPFYLNPRYDEVLNSDGWPSNVPLTAWSMIYGSAAGDNGEKLIARFAIDIREADGGPDGDWDEPGDTGDPSYTLNVNVTGASAGTHDAAAVPMAPADQPVYGSGGAGGNGGGGGAGASTVIIYEFATDKAGSVNQTATARGPGSGGPGGKGGKGGDGCILIFY